MKMTNPKDMHIRSSLVRPRLAELLLQLLLRHPELVLDIEEGVLGVLQAALKLAMGLGVHLMLGGHLEGKEIAKRIKYYNIFLFRMLGSICLIQL